MGEPTPSVEDAENYLREQTAKLDAARMRLEELMPYVREAFAILHDPNLARGRSMFDARFRVMKARAGAVCADSERAGTEFTAVEAELASLSKTI